MTPKATALLRSKAPTRIKNIIIIIIFATILFLALRFINGPGNDSTSPYLKSNASKKRVLAYYFPQFHEFQENNEFWGKGFTDFTNVARVTHDPMGFPVARPAERFGFYDLTEKSQRQYQASLAKAYGISGFIIMHYWFSSKPVMEKPLELLLEDGEPDIDFCLMWANEPWTARWDGLNGSDVLLAQTYEKSDWRSHFDWMVRFFKHKNYILVDNKPMLVIYRIVEVQELHLLLVQWQAWAIQAGFDGLHIVQNNGWKFTEDANVPQPGVEGIAEYYPNYYSFFKNMPAPIDQVSRIHKHSRVVFILFILYIINMS
jgi:lipopolysaccharide biosynthesis protein